MCDTAPHVAQSGVGAHRDVDHELGTRRDVEKVLHRNINAGSKLEDLESIGNVFVFWTLVMEGEMELDEGFLSVSDLPAALRFLPPP